MKLNYGDLGAIEVSKRIGAPVADLTELKGIPADRRVHGQLFHKLDDGSNWRFHSTSSLTGDDIITATPGAGSGRFLRMPGNNLLAIPIAFGTADATVLLTVPAGCILQPLEFSWRVTADWTGGASSTIGLSSSNKTGYTTKGDLLGGAAGDLAAVLVASSAPTTPGTIGAQWGTIALRRPYWKPTETLRHDRITSAYTAGTGFVLVNCNILQHNGA